MNKLFFLLLISTTVSSISQELSGSYDVQVKQAFPSISQGHWSRLRASMRRNTILLQGQAVKLRYNLNQYFLRNGNATTESVAFDLYMQEVSQVLDDFRNKLDQTPTTIVSTTEEEEEEEDASLESDAQTVFTFLPNLQEQIQLPISTSPSSANQASGLPVGRPNSQVSQSKPTPVVNPPPSIYRPNVPFMPSMPLLQGHASLGGNNGLGVGLSLNPNSLGQILHKIIG